MSEYSKRDKEKFYVNVVKEEPRVCNSYVGYMGGRYNNIPFGQPLRLGEKCMFEETIVHEFIHAIGFDHEQSRFGK